MIPDIIIIILILYIIYLLNIKKKVKPNNDIIPKNSTVMKPIVNNNIPLTTTYIIDTHNLPSFRGLVSSYKLPERNELGGSKIFKHIILDDKNKVNNVTNYKNYKSYRTKPIIKK